MNRGKRAAVDGSSRQILKKGRTEKFMLMKFYRNFGFSLAAVGVLVGCGSGDSKYETKVINGTVYDADLDRDGVNQATVRIWVKTSGNADTSCTATRVSARTFLTAAHCFYSQGMVDTVYIKTGYAPVYDRSKDKFLITDFSIHPDHVYLAPEVYDLLVFRIGEWDVERLSKVKIASVSFDPVEYYRQATFWGYGCTAMNELPDGHKRFGSSILSNSSALGAGFRNVNVTSADLDPKSPVLCSGDSGGPIVQYGQVVGVNTGYRSPYSYFARLDYNNVKNWYADFVERD